MSATLITDLPDCPKCNKAKLIPHHEPGRVILLCLSPECDYLKIKDFRYRDR